MVESFREIFISFALIGLFVLSMISFGVILQQDNGVSDTILGNSIINKTFNRLEGNLSSFRSTAQGQKESFESEIPERGFGTLLIFSIVTITQTFISMIVSVFNAIIILPAEILGVSPIVTGVIGAILLTSIVLLGWRVYRAGG